MQTDSLGIPRYSESDIEQLIYNGRLDVLSQLLSDIPSSVLDQFNTHSNEVGGVQLQSYEPLDISKEDFDQLLQSQWFMPDEYKQLDIEGYLVNICPKQNYNRLMSELQEFRSRNMLNLLRWLKYFVDMCRSNNIVWGVGRGSSVASYVLYLIGVHKIDPIKYNLDWHEFLR